MSGMTSVPSGDDRFFYVDSPTPSLLLKPSLEILEEIVLETGRKLDRLICCAEESRLFGTGNYLNLI